MNTAELFEPEPVLQIQDLGGLLEELSKQVTPPRGGLLRGEVLATFDGGSRVQLRDANRATVELRLEQPLRAARGDWVEVLGAPELVAETAPLGMRVVWRGETAKHLGEAPRFRERRAFAGRLASSLPFETPRISARLRGGGRLRVVTVRDSKSWDIVDEAARQYRWLKPDIHYCDEARSAVSLATVLTSLTSVIRRGDAVLIARDTVGMEEILDLFEDQRVVEALAKLTERCATILAVGHTGDELLANKVVTYPVESAAAAIHLILRESGARSIEIPAAAPVASVEEETERSAAAVGSGSAPRIPWMRWVLVGAAAYLGWWARGWQSGEPHPPPDHPAMSPGAAAASSPG